MASIATQTGIVLRVPGELLGPGSEFEERRLALRQDWQKIVLAAKNIKVTDAASCEEATRLGRVLQASAKEVELFYKPVKAAIDELKKPVLDYEREDISQITVEKTRLGAEITEYNAEQERIREIAERAAREAAEKAAREALLEHAVALAESGDNEAADAMLEDPIVPPPVVIQRGAPVRVTGQVAKSTYWVEVVDEKALIKAVAEGRAPAQAITVDMGYLNRRANLDGEAFNVPGCKLNKKVSTFFRS